MDYAEDSTGERGRAACKLPHVSLDSEQSIYKVMRVTRVKPVGGCRLELEFDDGVSGVVDLSDLAGVGVFAAWLNPGFFEQVTITNDGALAWPGDLDLCPDAIYLRLTGKPVEEVFPSLRPQPAYA